MRVAASSASNVISVKLDSLDLTWTFDGYSNLTRSYRAHLDCHLSSTLPVLGSSRVLLVDMSMLRLQDKQVERREETRFAS